MLNSYETIYILTPDVNEETNIKTVNEYKSLIKQYGGQNIFIQHKGKRHLNFSINKNYDGLYVQINYEGNGIIVKTLEKAMKFDENIIRYLTIKQNNNHVQNIHI
uniref:30S ribosomal protein S6, chloroplastic n=1 Tax=Gastroclonium compressum TaxID=1852973 RepID=A0A173FZR4_GASCM|nr:ribosomal protein S6 [Coeloseira compressa]ANH09521.1 ribosomal protein S6 [Coeloseira compressa]